MKIDKVESIVRMGEDDNIKFYFNPFPNDKLLD